MRANRYIKPSSSILSGMLMLMLGLASCGTEREPEKYVDLRFTAENEYVLEASGAAPIVFNVRSSDPWEVFGTTPDWCSITPTNGERDSLSTVTVQYVDNTELDDRIDTITIKSDHWVGQQSVVRQKGIAYLNVADVLSEQVDKGGAIGLFTIRSNQDWSVVPHEDSKAWISISSGEKGTLDGTVVYSIKANAGEVRNGLLLVCDRHDVVQHEISINQGGVIINPALEEIRLAHDVTSYTLDVDANTKWQVTKDDELAAWYSFEQTEFDGGGELTIVMDANAGNAIRKASFTLSTLAAEGTEPIKKTVKLKQGYYPKTTRYEFEASEVANWNLWNGKQPTVIDGNDLSFVKDSRVYKSNQGYGRYTFAVKSMNAATQVCIYLGYYDFGQQFQIIVEKAKCKVYAKGMVEPKPLDLDTSKPFTVGLEVSKGKSGYIEMAWFLDGKEIHRYANENGDVKIENDQPAQLLWGVRNNVAVYGYWEYTEVLDWGL